MNGYRPEHNILKWLRIHNNILNCHSIFLHSTDKCQFSNMLRRPFLFNSLPHEYTVSQIFWCSTRTWSLFSFSKLSLLKWSVICWLAFQFLVSCAVCNYYHNTYIYYFNNVMFYFRLLEFVIFIKKLCNYEESGINISLN